MTQDAWTCVVCGGSTRELARVICESCNEYHDICFACAAEADRTGRGPLGPALWGAVESARAAGFVGSGLVIIGLAGAGASLCQGGGLGPA